MTFTGFPKEALDFYDDLELDNTKSYWTAHRDVYETCVKAPMIELTGALEEEFGPAKVYRPYRDVRFSKDKTPYKDHQGAYVARAPDRGGTYDMGCWRIRRSWLLRSHPRALAAIRRAIADDRSGTNLLKLLAGLERKGWTRGGAMLKPSRRGTPLTTRISNCCGTGRSCCTRATALTR